MVLWSETQSSERHIFTNGNSHDCFIVYKYSGPKEQPEGKISVHDNAWGGRVGISLNESLAEGIRYFFGIRVIDMKPWGPVWRIVTPAGVYAVKRTRQQPEQILQLAQILKRFHEAGFPHTMTLHTTKSGKPFARIGNDNYLVSPWIEGENPDFTNRRQLQMVAGLYGSFHRISSALTCPNQAGEPGEVPVRAIRNELFKKRNFLMETRDSLGRLENPNRIERLIMKWSEHFIRQADFCIGQLPEPGIEQGCHYQRWQGFCHNDPAPRNIIIRNRAPYLIDFELAACGPFVQETAKLIVRALQANQWPPGLIPLILEAYRSERALSAGEMHLLPCLCAFPQGFWRLCSQRYQERLPWTENRFYKRLWEITSQEPARIKCFQSMLPDLPEPAAHMRTISIPSRRML